METFAGESQSLRPDPVDLAPARWIWLPSERTLPNTFVLFRKPLRLEGELRRATALVAADSRYRLSVNGRRVQWGPAPCDPRSLDADPVDLLPFLGPGDNVVGIEVLYFGVGEGTWVMGKPGLLARVELERADGRAETVCSDAGWSCCLNRARPPGGPKRWYLRALQERFDARLYPNGWDAPGFEEGADWQPAMELDAPSDGPPLRGSYEDYLNEASFDAEAAGGRPGLRLRQIPPMDETPTPPFAFGHAVAVRWKRPLEDWFSFRSPGAFALSDAPEVAPEGDGSVRLPACGAGEGYAVAYCAPEQMVGFPQFEIEAPAGTDVRLVAQEGHDPGSGVRWLDSGYFAWSQWICEEGTNRFEAFEYESLRWLQLHVSGHSRPVALRRVGLLRRVYPFAREPRVRVSDPALQRLAGASLNTLRNGAQETMMDCVGRERQQYSGDLGHALRAVRYAFGERRQPRRFLRTYSEGQTFEGYFIDNWPAFDRTVRIPQRLLGLTKWGPILDHSVGFVFDAASHYLETGQLEALEEPYPRIRKLFAYFRSGYEEHGLLPVSQLGVPYVWIDHDAYRCQEDKRCAYNLYLAAMCAEPLPLLARAMGDEETARKAEEMGAKLARLTAQRYWSEELGLFCANLPELAEGAAPRLCDRSLATAVIHELCPGGRVEPSLDALERRPPNMGLSYPPNQVWRHWALTRHGRTRALVEEYRRRWATMDSVRSNNAMPEHWRPKPDGRSQYSHAAIAPLLLLYTGFAGIQPTRPGFVEAEIRPCLDGIDRLELDAHTPLGPIRFRAEPACAGRRRLQLDIPDGVKATLIQAKRPPLALRSGANEAFLER